MTRPMKAIVGEVDQTGLLRLLPADTDPSILLGLDPVGRHLTTLVWALLDDADAEDLREDVRAGAIATPAASS